MEAEKPKIGELIGRETAMNNASMSAVSVCATKLLGAQTQRSHEHSSIGMEIIPRGDDLRIRHPEKRGANANHDGRRPDCVHQTYDMPLSQSSLG
jgi:hypothetical protein